MTFKMKSFFTTHNKKNKLTNSDYFQKPLNKFRSSNFYKPFIGNNQNNIMSTLGNSLVKLIFYLNQIVIEYTQNKRFDNFRNNYNC